MLFDADAVFLGIAPIDGQPEPDSGEGIGQIGQVHVGGKGVFPRRNPFGEGRFRHSIDHDIAVQDAFRGLMAADILHDVGNGPYGLVRHPGKGIERSSALNIPENHDRSRSQLVYDDFGTVRDLCLRQVGRQHVQASFGQDFMHHFQLSGVYDIAFAAADLPQDGLCDVVLGGAQTAGGDDDGVPGKGVLKDGSDFLPVVSDGNHPFDMDSGFFQSLCELSRIGIDHLADENFIADGADNGIDHTFSDVCFSKSFNSLASASGRMDVSMRLAPARSSSMASSGVCATPITGILPWHSSRLIRTF